MTQYKDEYACDNCGASPARISSAQGNFMKVYYCRKHHAKQ